MMAQRSHEHRLIARPGDTLILTLAHRISDQQYDTMRRCAEESMPGLKVAIIENVGTATIYRTDDEVCVRARLGMPPREQP